MYMSKSRLSLVTAMATVLIFCFINTSLAQGFLFGADLSYVNEMEDCGVIYKESNTIKDPYQIFADHNCNVARIRLWHSPSWYDTLNSGKRFSDFADVRLSILRAKAANMQVLLDFHLSDTWADPQHQVVPKAWESVVNNLPLLKDSLYNYIQTTLLALNNEGLLPEMVQIGNETNRGILLSPAVDAAGWVLDWNRNSQLFKRAIQAVRGVEAQTGKAIKVALHLAGPADTGWLMQGFWNNGVTDFDIIGMSYYWAWHKPTNIEQAGNVVAQMRSLYPNKEVMIFETGYIWTLANNDNANNIIAETHPDYSPASPDHQREWLIDLTKKVIEKGGKGVFYWEPAWVSSTCFTPWGQGSHQEHATFFDFQNNMLPNGGMQWMTHDYGLPVASKEVSHLQSIKVVTNKAQNQVTIFADGLEYKKAIDVEVLNLDGRILVSRDSMEASIPIQLSMPSGLASGIYFLTLKSSGKIVAVQKIIW